jgi:hypothetical protein
LAVTRHDGVAQRAQEFGAHAVGGIRAVEAQPRDAVGDIQQHRSFIDHGRFPPFAG